MFIILWYICMLFCIILLIKTAGRPYDTQHHLVIVVDYDVHTYIHICHKSIMWATQTDL